MLTHLNPHLVRPARTVVLGAGGSVGAAVVRRLEAAKCDVLALLRVELDLLSPAVAARLARLLRPDHALVAVSARVPVKTAAHLIENLQMMAAITAALAHVPVRHVVYFSSDAVYADSDAPLTEDSCAGPGTIHGVMHLAREVMLANAFSGPLCLLRPTLIYGAADPHNGYSPNRFRRAAASGRPIVLFGEGEELRDHVLIDDVAEVVYRVLLHRSVGILNVATGQIASFREIAKMVSAQFAPRPAIKGSPRQGPMPHRGYRPFDTRACAAAFPHFRYTPLADGLTRTHGELRQT